MIWGFHDILNHWLETSTLKLPLKCVIPCRLFSRTQILLMLATWKPDITCLQGEVSRKELPSLAVTCFFLFGTWWREFVFQGTISSSLGSRFEHSEPSHITSDEGRLAPYTCHHKAHHESTLITTQIINHPLVLLSKYHVTTLHSGCFSRKYFFSFCPSNVYVLKLTFIL